MSLLVQEGKEQMPYFLHAESYIDGLYVENDREFCKNIKEVGRIVLGGATRPREELPNYLKR